MVFGFKKFIMFWQHKRGIFEWKRKLAKDNLNLEAV